MNDSYAVSFNPETSYAPANDTPAIYDQQQLSLIWDVLSSESPAAVRVKKIMGEETIKKLELIFATRMRLLANAANEELSQSKLSNMATRWGGRAMGDTSKYSEAYKMSEEIQSNNQLKK